VALGIAVITPVVFVVGLKLKELVVSTTNPPWKSDAPPHIDDALIAQLGAYMIATGVFTSLQPLSTDSKQLDQTARSGSSMLR